MPDPGIYAFSIRKSRSWRGQVQGFSNLYHYNMAAPTEASLTEVLDALKAAEVPIFDSGATFVEGRAWGPVQSNGRGGRMEAVKQFSGTGSQTMSTSTYRECAYLVYWPLGRYGSRNRPQFIRKWLHTLGLNVSTNQGPDGTTDLGAPAAALTTYMSTVRNLLPVPGGVTIDLTTASGHTPISAGKLYKYLEHRQYGR